MNGIDGNKFTQDLVLARSCTRLPVRTCPLKYNSKGLITINIMFMKKYDDCDENHGHEECDNHDDDQDHDNQDCDDDHLSARHGVVEPSRCSWVASIICRCSS